MNLSLLLESVRTSKKGSFLGFFFINGELGREL